jgi:predicted component of type VI protein secretion system
VIGSRGRGDASGGEATLPLAADRGDLALALALLGPGIEREVALHGRASWSIGRAPDNDIVVDHRSISRHHARLHAGDGFALEALAATNPLRIGSRALAPGERVPIAAGEAFAIGALVGVIRPLSAPAAVAESSQTTAPGDSPPRSLRDALADEERRRIVEALRRSAGNQSRAAELLGMPRRTLVKRLREYAIPRGRIVPDGDG